MSVRYTSQFVDGYRYIVDDDGSKVRLDIDFYKNQPGFNDYIKKHRHENFSSINDVNGFTNWARENHYQGDQPPADQLAEAQKTNQNKSDDESSNSDWEKDYVKYEDSDAAKQHNEILKISQRRVPTQLNITGKKGVSDRMKETDQGNLLLDGQRLKQKDGDQFKVDKKDAKKLGIDKGKYTREQITKKVQRKENNAYIKKHYSGDSSLPKRPKRPKMPTLKLPGGITKTKVDSPSGLGGKVFEYSADGNYNYDKKDWNPKKNRVKNQDLAPDPEKLQRTSKFKSTIQAANETAGNIAPEKTRTFKERQRDAAAKQKKKPAQPLDNYGRKEFDRFTSRLEKNKTKSAAPTLPKK